MNTKGITALIAIGTIAGFGLHAANADVIQDGGFELGTAPGLLLPTNMGVWSGDVTEVVTAQDDIIPFEGTQMVHFIYSTPRGPYGGIIGSELWQIVDLTGYRSMIDRGNAVATAEGWFNRIGGEDPNIDTQFSIVLSAYSGAASDFPTMWKHGELALSEGFAYTDGDVRSWEVATTSLTIPTESDFLVYRITATENVFDDALGTEFHGHYGDAFTLSITEVPAPASLVMMFGGALTIGATRRRRHA